jgi:hypothetical protein
VTKGQFIFIAALVLLQLGAACAYLAAKDYKRALYWTLGAAITIVVSL